LSRLRPAARTSGSRRPQQLDHIQSQVTELLGETFGQAKQAGDTLRRSVVENPMASLTTAFAAGVIAAFLTIRR
jgi:hypothetical protein